MADLDELERLARAQIAAEAAIDGFVGETPSREWGAALAAEAEAYGDLAAALDGPSVLDLIARVRAAEAEAMRWRGRVTRLKSLIWHTAARLSRRGHYDHAQRLVAGYDEILKTEAAPEDFVLLHGRD